MKLPHRLSNREVSPFLNLICSILIVAATFASFMFLTYKESAAQDIVLGGTFNIASDMDFKNYQDVIRRFVRKHRLKTSEDFCIVGYIAADNSKLAWVLWDQGKEIILWEPGESDLDLSRRKINLEKDVVDFDIDLHGSTYLVTRLWVDNLVTACSKDGTQLHVEMPEKVFRR